MSKQIKKATSLFLFLALLVTLLSACGCSTVQVNEENINKSAFTTSKRPSVPTNTTTKVKEYFHPVKEDPKPKGPAVCKTDPSPEEDKVVYLTFDDGPGKYTKDILSTLDKYNAKATFFVTNQYPSYQDCIAKEAKKGHTVAIHTYSHTYSKIYKSTDAYMKDLDQMNGIIIKQTGKHSYIVRFPGGSSNTVSRKYKSGIMTELTALLPKKGYYYVDWNVDSRDAENASAESIYNNVIRGLQNHSCSVVLMHDVKENTMNALPRILQWGKENGYTFKAMTTSSYMPHHSVNN